MKDLKTRLNLLLIIVIPLFSIGQNLNVAEEILLDTITTDGRPGITISFNKLTGQKFVLEMPEIFTLRGHSEGLLGYKYQNWKFSKKGAYMSYEDKDFKYSIKLRQVKSRNSIGLKWSISLKNLTDSTLYDLAPFNCWSMNLAPLFKDLSMNRTFVEDLLGNKTSLKQVLKNQGEGKRTMQFYPVYRGVPDLSKTLWVNRWGVISDQKLSGNKISVISSDSKWLFENKVNGKVAYFFNNWEPDHGCIHASPLLASSLPPGKKAKSEGIFLFSNLEK